MIAVDVNVLVHAWQPDAPEHARYRAWLEAAASAPEPLGLAPVVLSGALRVLTHPRVFERPNRVRDVLHRIEALRARPNTVELVVGPRHWDIFAALCEHIDARGNDVPDAYLAALAIETGSTWVTADAGFARFPGLRWRHPFAS